jgi:O-antigen/teichoic acid export membrane protein
MKQSRFWKLSLGSGAVTAVRILCAFLSNKLLALFLGPSGFAVAAQFQNFLAIGQGTSSLAMQNGWISLTSRLKKNTDQLHTVWSAGLRLTALAIIGTAGVLTGLAFLAPVENWFPHIPLYQIRLAFGLAVFGVLATTITMIAQSVMNGLEQYRRWALISVASTALQTLWVAFFLWCGRLEVLSILATQSLLSAFVSAFIACRGGFSFYKNRPASNHFGLWKSFILMGIVPMLLSPLMLTVVRSFLGTRLGWHEAGLWQGAVRISDFFNVGFSSMLGVLLLPQFSAMKSREKYLITLYSFLFRVLITAFFCALLLFLFRSLIIPLILSREFSALEYLLPIQLAGDFFRSGCWCLGLALIARQATKAFLAVEIASELTFAGLTIIGVSHFGIQTPFIAYVVENGLCFITLLIVTRKLPWNPL